MIKAAQFPGKTWDQSSPSRLKPNQVIEAPDANDWDQIAAEVAAVQDRVLGNTYPSWTQLTPAHNWVDPGTPNFGYRLVGGRVYLRGILNAGVTIADATVMTTLPAGARPTNLLTFAVPPKPTGTGDANMRVVIAADGTVKCYGLTSTDSIDFNGISFFLDQ